MHKSEIALKNLLSNVCVKKGEHYYHYRNKTNIYKIVNIALDEQSESPVVVYKALYGEKLTWTRPLNKWCDLIEHNNCYVTRFSKIKS